MQKSKCYNVLAIAILPQLLAANVIFPNWSGYPFCARECLLDNYRRSNCTSAPDDIAVNGCLCTNEWWLNASAACTFKDCGEDDLRASARQAFFNCKQGGHEIEQERFIKAGNPHDGDLPTNNTSHTTNNCNGGNNSSVGSINCGGGNSSGSVINNNDPPNSDEGDKSPDSKTKWTSEKLASVIVPVLVGALGIPTVVYYVVKCRSARRRAREAKSRAWPGTPDSTTALEQDRHRSAELIQPVQELAGVRRPDASHAG